MTKKIPFLDLKAANAHLEDRYVEAAERVIRSGWYINGPEVHHLEEEIAKLCNTRFCVAVSNGLDALRLILRAYKQMGQLNAGDKVVVPANTYVATVLAITDNDLVPVFCEPDLETMNLSGEKLMQIMDAEIKAVMPVHLYGTPASDELLYEIAKAHHLLVIEDNAQAIGATSAVPGIHGTKQTGSLGHAAGISFYPTKNVGALGDAGAVVTNDEELANTVRTLANYGADRRYHNIMQGLNCRMDELQAALLMVKLSDLEFEENRRISVAQTYDRSITNPSIIKPRIYADMKQVWHQYVIRTANRDHLIKYLERCGIGSDIHYATPPHKQPCYQQYGLLNLPITEQLAREVVSLPIGAPMDVATAEYISQLINQA